MVSAINYKTSWHYFTRHQMRLAPIFFGPRPGSFPKETYSIGGTRLAATV
jgi:hypothetical protein